MNKCMINFKAVDRKKAEVLLKALNEFEATQLSHNFRERRLVRSGQLVHGYMQDCAAMSKRIFTRLNRDRFNKAIEKFANPIEKDDCFTKLRTLEEKTVLRFCQNCRGEFWKYMTTIWVWYNLISASLYILLSDIKCPINKLFARFLLRTCQFIHEFNGIKQCRLTLADFATRQEIDVLRAHYLTESNRPIPTIGIYARGSYGVLDEVYDDATIVRIR